jgi:chloramphenicol O-acetyltransferase type A
MKIIDLASWARASHYQHFRNVANPHFSLTASVEVTPVMEVFKPAGLSVFNSILFALIQSANQIPEFRTRFRADQLVEHKMVGASFTIPLEGDRFGFCDVPFENSFSAFDESCTQTTKQARAQTTLDDKITGQDNWIYLSCLPWVNFTAMNNPLDGPDDCIPRIVWGKIIKSHNRWHMPVGIEAHHALMDGLHIARFFEKLEKNLGNVKTFLPANRSPQIK